MSCPGHSFALCPGTGHYRCRYCGVSVSSTRDHAFETHEPQATKLERRFSNALAAAGLLIMLIMLLHWAGTL